MANLVGQILIVVTGGAVRLTASGLGCSSWPACEPGHFTPALHGATSYHPFVEFGNRTVAALLVVVAIAVVVVGGGLDRRRSTGYRVLTWVPLVGVLVQAVVGGMAVRYDLPPAVVGSHMLISMVLVAVSTWLWVRSREGDGPVRWLVPRGTRVLTAALFVMGTVVVALGVVTTGAGPHSGDDRIGYRFAVDPLTMARVHAAAVWVFVALLALTIYQLQVRVRHAAAAAGTGLETAPDPGAAGVLQAGYRLLGVTAAQAVIGYAQVATGLPIALVNLHMLGAALLVTALTLVAGRLRTRPAGPEPTPVAGAVDVPGTAAA
jgi:cytochrome c oxidase assembly protein subunit 15